MLGNGSNRMLLGILLAFFLLGIVLCLFRSPAGDETYYLKDALDMSARLQQGRWFGNEAVGFHGFLFKLPAALLFLIFGPSVFIATLTNVLFAVSAVYLSYLLMLHYLESTTWAAVGCVLTGTSVFFLRALATFNRDTPMLAALLLFLLVIVKKKNKWIIGLSFLLLLDAKETVFFMVLPGYLLWLFVQEYRQVKNNPLQDSPPSLLGRLGFLKGFALRLSASLLPSLLFIAVMFTTVLIPLNPVLSYELGFNEGGFYSFLHSSFNPGIVTSNLKSGSDGGEKIIAVENCRWKSINRAEAKLMPAEVTVDGFAVVHLIKPPDKRGAKAGHKHICYMTSGPEKYLAGEKIVYSFYYNTASKRPKKLRTHLRYTDKKLNLLPLELSLQNDGKWHFEKLVVNVTQPGTILPELIWEPGSDMELYMAGCHFQKQENIAETISLEPDRSGFSIEPKKVFTYLSSYLRKLFYSRTFSFTTMPRFIILPALLMSGLLFRRWYGQGDCDRLILPLILWPFLLIYLMRTSYGRHMLPMVPVLVLLFFFFLRDGLSHRPVVLFALVGSFLFTAPMFFFNPHYPLFKLILSTLGLAGLWLLYYIHQKQKGRVEAAKFLFIGMLAALMVLVFVGTSFSNQRQLGRYKVYGSNGQAAVIAGAAAKKEKIWVNHQRNLIEFFRQEAYNTPFALQNWQWRAGNRLPRWKRHKNAPFFFTYSSDWLGVKPFRDMLLEKGITKVMVSVSTLKNPQYHFPLQEYLPRFNKLPYLERTQTLHLKNKDVFIYAVKNIDKADETLKR